MRKLWILGILVALFLTGCGARPKYAADIAESLQENITVEDTTATDTTVTTDSIDTKVSQEITSKQSEATKVSNANKGTTQSTTAAVARDTNSAATTTIPKPKTIPLNVSTNNERGTLKFTSAKIDYDYQRVTLYYEMDSTGSNELYLREEETFCKDKNGKVIRCDGAGGVMGEPIKDSASVVTGYKGGTGSFRFYKFDKASDLSTITVTYVFKDCKPVTVTINIPGV